MKQIELFKREAPHRIISSFTSVSGQVLFAHTESIVVRARNVTNTEEDRNSLGMPRKRPRVDKENLP